MKISRIVVTRGRKLHLENYDVENYEIKMESVVEERDDPQDIIQGLKTLLDRHLDSWEKSLKEINSSEENSAPPIIKTAADLVSDDSKSEILSNSVNMSEKDSKKQLQEEQQLICPKCNEVMTKKDGKDYYLCSKHWGYPDMIKNGQVRDKKY